MISVIVRSECDRCHVVTEENTTDYGPMTTVPPGWRIFAVSGVPHLWCDACVEGLERFRKANEDVEQSR